MSGPLVVVGDVLLDVDLDGSADRLSPDAPVPVVDRPESRSRPGGAGLAAVLAARLAAADVEVHLVAAFGADSAGRRARRLLSAAGVLVHPLAFSGETPSKTRVRVGGQSVVRIDRGGGEPAFDDLGAGVCEAIARASCVLVADYGNGMADHPAVRDAIGRRGRKPLVWDPHPRGPAPIAGAHLVTPNLKEIGLPPDAGFGLVARRAEHHRREWEAHAVAVTMGGRGALLAAGSGPPLVCPPSSVAAGDPCGAGDAFAVGCALAMGAGAVASEAVQSGVACAGDHVAGVAVRRPAPSGAVEDLRAVCQSLESLRARGIRVVATGGCFDVLHAGHVAMLAAARALGDVLVVCLNSDDSVRRLKGPGRPAQPAADRAAVLRALACVDHVVAFDEDTPEAVVRQLRPAVWAKGGDYGPTAIPEAEAVRAGGGDVVILPYLDGRSTTRILEHRPPASIPEPARETMRSIR